MTIPSLTITLDGKPIALASISGTLALTSAAAASPALRVGPGELAAAAKTAPAGATIILGPGVYREAPAFDRPVTVQSWDWTPGRPPPALGAPPLTVLIDATGLALPEDKAAILFKAGGTVRGVEIVGAASTKGNGSGIRNYPAQDVTVEDCAIHGNEMGALFSGGVITFNRVDSHHNTGDGNCHNLYYGEAMPGGSLVLTDSRLWHSPNGSCIKSRALKTTITRCWAGSVSVPVAMPGLLPKWGAMNPPPPDSTPGAPRVWLGDHQGCDCGGEACASGVIDIPDGGEVSIADSVLLSATTRQQAVYRYAFESVKNGGFDQSIDRTTISKQCTTALGNRAPGTALVLTDCALIGDMAVGGYRWGAQPIVRDVGKGLLPAPVIRFAGSTPAGG